MSPVTSISTFLFHVISLPPIISFFFKFYFCKVRSSTVVPTYYTRGVHKRNLHFKNLNKTEVKYSELHTYISQHGNPQRFVSNDIGHSYMYASPLLLHSTRCVNGYHITEELVCSAWQSCILHTISHITTQPTMPSARQSSRESAFSKQRALVCLLCL